MTIALSEVEGFTREVLTAGRQWISKILELLILGAGVGLIMGVVPFLLTCSPGGLSQPDATTNFLALFALGIGIIFISGVFLSLPTLLGIRTVDLFTLRFQNGRQWDFGVSQQQAEKVAEILESYRRENQ